MFISVTQLDGPKTLLNIERIVGIVPDTQYKFSTKEPINPDGAVVVMIGEEMQWSVKESPDEVRSMAEKSALVKLVDAIGLTFYIHPDRVETIQPHPHNKSRSILIMMSGTEIPMGTGVEMTNTLILSGGLK